jgi:hypothetical protein
MSDAAGPYTDSWQSYRRWYLASLGMFVGYLPVGVTIGMLFPGIISNNRVIFPLFGIYAISWIALTNVARRWPCPRCGEDFFGSLWLPQLPMLFVRSCRYCGLPKNAPADPDPPTMSFTRVG